MPFCRSRRAFIYFPRRVRTDIVTPSDRVEQQSRLSDQLKGRGTTAQTFSMHAHTPRLDIHTYTHAMNRHTHMCSCIMSRAKHAHAQSSYESLKGREQDVISRRGGQRLDFHSLVTHTESSPCNVTFFVKDTSPQDTETGDPSL